jgi:HK97 family phage major capsid protein
MSRKDDLILIIQKSVKAADDISKHAQENGGDFTAEDREALQRLLDEGTKARGELDTLKADSQLRRDMKSLGDDLGWSSETGDMPPDVLFGRKGKTLGQFFTESVEWKGFMASFPGGNIPEKARIQSPVLAVKSLLGQTAPRSPGGQKTLLYEGSLTSAGAMVIPDYTGILERLGRPPLVIRDLLSVRTTVSDIVWFVQQITRVQAAAPTPEATTTATGGTKPEGGFTFQQISAPVRTIAEWIPATKRALADVGQLMGIIDDELRQDLGQTEENQLLNGDGTGENLTGILNTSGIQVVAFVAGTNLFDSIYKGITAARWTGFVEPSGVVVHPTDNQTMMLAKDQYGRYFGNGPFQQGPDTIWGLAKVVTPKIAQGTALVADFAKGVIWDRMAATVSVSDSHADFFVRNMVAVLGEQRETFGVLRPVAFVKVALQ